LLAFLHLPCLFLLLQLQCLLPVVKLPYLLFSLPLQHLLVLVCLPGPFFLDPLLHLSRSGEGPRRGCSGEQKKDS